MQGKDAARGVGLMESHQRFSATLKNFYVQISRGVFGMTLVTDDRESLIKAIENNPDDKHASLDMISSKQLVQHKQRFLSQTNFSIQPVIDKKITQEKSIKEISFSKPITIQKQQIVKELER